MIEPPSSRSHGPKALLLLGGIMAFVVLTALSHRRRNETLPSKLTSEGPSLPPGCDGSAVNTWQPTWASSADAACALWAVSDDWGALVGGQTAEEACLTPWAQDECAATCCTYSSEDQPTPVDVEVCVIAAEGDLPKLDGLSVSGGLSGVQKWGPNP